MTKLKFHSENLAQIVTVLAGFYANTGSVTTRERTLPLRLFTLTRSVHEPLRKPNTDVPLVTQ